jgi:hypothetical protein
MAWVAVKLFNLAVVNSVLCYGSYRSELHRRRSFLVRQHLAAEKVRLQMQTADLKNAVWEMIQHNLDLDGI